MKFDQTGVYEIKGIGLVGVFKKAGTCVVNTTPHSIRLKEGDTIVEIPSCCILNAKPKEEVVSKYLVTTKFEGTDEGVEQIKAIENAYLKSGLTESLFIIGSIIAAQAYKGSVVAMTPCPGYERVVPDEKLMNCDKFTVFI